VPPFVVFGDVTLQDLARRRPTTAAGFRQVHGVGDHKARQYADTFTAAITDYCARHEVPADAPMEEEPAPESSLDALTTATKSAARQAADRLFREGRSIDEVMLQTGRARSTVTQYLVEFVTQTARTSPEPWVDEARFAAVIAAAQITGHERLKPIFDHLNGAVPFDAIRICLACLGNDAG
jgi:ATP-dependent DNA helicase RecQ